MTLIKRKIIVFSFSFWLFFFAMPVFAFNTYLESESNEMSPGQSFKVDFFLNTEGKDINAIEGKIVFSSEILESRQIIEGGSIISFWVERPKIESENQIIFSGGLPGGFIGDRGLIFSIIFQLKETGSVNGGNINAENIKVFLNDGSGASTNISLSSFNFNVTKEEKTDMKEIEDANLPELFVPYIGRDPNIFDNKWFVAFATKDKGLGIDYYKVWENTQKYDINNINNVQGIKWTKAESPYLLKDQELQNYIYVKAVDKAGNERIAVMLPGKSGSSVNYNNALIAVAVISLLILTSLFFPRILSAFKNKTRH